MKLSVLLIDDEQAAHYALLDLLQDYPEINVVGEAFDGKQGIELTHQLKPDLIFLDIQMQDMTGFEMIAHLEYHPHVVFCTAYDKYAIDAFEENAIDYLLKPVDKIRFAKTIDKIRLLHSKAQNIDYARLISAYNEQHTRNTITAVPVYVGSKIILVRCNEIVYCEMRDGYASLLTDKGSEHVCNLKLKELEERLPDHFLRVHKSIIVNTDKIGEIHKYFNNRLIFKGTSKNSE